MSKRIERRAAERLQRKAAYQQLRQQRAQSAAIPESPILEPTTMQEPLLETSEQVSNTSEHISQSPSISEAQLTANRANAQLSLGPRSSEGKFISSQNALKHGLTSKTVVLAGEDQARYDHNLQVHIERYQPATDEELRLVQAIVDNHWRIARCLRIETALLRKGELEFESKFRDHNAADQAFLSLAELYLKYEKPLRNLHIQENRLRRNLEKDTAALRDLQATRQREEQRQALDPKPQKRNGFVFTPPSANPPQGGFSPLERDRLPLAEAA